MRQWVTLKTIAKKTGYSVTTVSRALAGYNDVSEETRQKIQAAARELGYYPNQTARQLQKQRTDTVGLILPFSSARFADPYFSLVLAGIGDELSERGIDLLISTRPPGPSEIEAYKHMVEGRRVDGLVVIRTRREDERIVYLVERGFPFAAFGRTDLGLDYPCIDEDGQAGTYELVTYLAGLGHERIAYIAAPQDLMFGHYRHEGYRQALQAADLPYDEQLVIKGDLTRRGGAAATEQLLASEPWPTAIVAANDLMAVGTMNVAQERGVVVGRDLSVAGFDDIPTAEALSLTTLHQPIYDIGHRLSQMLAMVIARQELDEQQILLKPELIVRDSVAPPSRGRSMS